MSGEGSLTEGVKLFVKGNHPPSDLRLYVNNLLRTEIDTVRRDQARAEIYALKWANKPGDPRLAEAQRHVEEITARIEEVRVDARKAARTAVDAGVNIDMRTEQALLGIGAMEPDEAEVAKRTTKGQPTARVSLGPDERSGITRMLHQEYGAAKSLSLRDRIESGVEVFTQQELAKMSLASGERTPQAVSEALVDLRRAPQSKVRADVTRSRDEAAGSSSVLEALVRDQRPAYQAQRSTPDVVPTWGAVAAPVYEDETPPYDPEADLEVEEDPVGSGVLEEDSSTLEATAPERVRPRTGSTQPTLF